MSWLLRDFDLLSVVLRALSFALEAMLLGGLVFALWVAAPAGADAQRMAHIRRAASVAAVGFALVQGALAGLSVAMLVGGSGLPLASVISARFFLAGVAAALCAVSIAGLLRARGQGALWIALLPALGLLLSMVAVSHAASRMEDVALVAVLTAAHHVGMAGWIGAMGSLLLALRHGSPEPKLAARMARRYSSLAMVSVGLLIGGGVGLSYFYVWSGMAGAGLWGTSYGILVMAKVYLVLVMLLLGASNQRVLRGAGAPAAGLLLRLRRFSEVEIGLGLTAVLAAASLTSQTPAVDMAVQDRLTGHEIAERLRWQAPRLTSPPLAALAPPNSLADALAAQDFGAGSASDANDRAWSEYNHHWAGLIVLAAGLLALAGRAAAGPESAKRESAKRGLAAEGRETEGLAAEAPSGELRGLYRFGGEVARGWPLLFLGLALLILLRADPENWPLGPRPFWASFSRPDVLEHRLYAVLVSLFALFEWAVETGRLRSAGAAYVFPLVCAVGGGALLTHSHDMGNVHEETLAELSHSAIAVLGAMAGSGRWLELRLPGSRAARVASLVWPVCLGLVGVVLLDYRES